MGKAREGVETPAVRRIKEREHGRQVHFRDGQGFRSGERTKPSNVASDSCSNEVGCNW